MGYRRIPTLTFITPESKWGYMTETGLSDEPVCKPWLVRLLRRRPKLVEIEARDKFLENLDRQICERRKPDNVAARLSRNSLRSAETTFEPVVAGTVRDRLAEANGRMLRRL